jgi:hypothetical protein
MHIAMPVSATPDATTADERWAAWVARGVAHDKQSRKRAIAAAAFVATGIGIWLAIALLLG